MDSLNFSTSTAGANTADTTKTAKPSTIPTNSTTATSEIESAAEHPESLPAPPDSIVAAPRQSRSKDARSHSRSISSSSVTGSLPTRKSRYSEPGTSEIHAELITFSAQSNHPRSIQNPRSVLPRSRCHSETSESVFSEDSVPEEPDLGDADDLDTPRLQATTSRDSAPLPLLPEPILDANGSISAKIARRPSANSISSSSSTRVFKPLVSSPATDSLSRLRSSSCLMSSNKAPNVPQSQSEAGLSNVTVTTSSGTESGQVSVGNQHNLTTRDSHSQPLDVMKRTQRFDNVNTNPGPGANTNANNATPARSQPSRSRSRVKRRFSGSTANSSHSPSSDRGPPHREKEEGTLSITAESIRQC